MNSELSLIKKEANDSKIFLNLYNRSNRLVSAVFLVMSVVENNSDIKEKIKENALELIPLCVSLKEVRGAVSSNILSQIEKKILELLSFLEVAAVAGFVSQMNTSILRKEFESFLVSIAEFANGVEELEQNSLNEVLASKNESQGPTKTSMSDTKPVSQDQRGFARVIDQDLSKIKDENKGHNRKDLRKNAILEYVRNHPNVSIKEIAPNIKGCGEKTIQRELVDLVGSGLVHRVGERRWSRYTVA